MQVHPTISYQIEAILNGRDFEAKKMIYLQDCLNFGVSGRLFGHILLEVGESGLGRFKITCHGFAYIFDGKKDFVLNYDEFWKTFHSNLPSHLQGKVKC